MNTQPKTIEVQLQSEAGTAVVQIPVGVLSEAGILKYQGEYYVFSHFRNGDTIFTHAKVANVGDN